ncbi:hypothetical protein BGX24_005160 [Mortierella sp. AD032]|nr:hypothetical protein BGX24_005160 [Mortierella sp. AD032]
MSSSSTLPNPYPRHHRQAQLRVLDISGCEYLQSDRMYILLTCLPGLQVVDFRCRQHLYQLFSDSGLKYDRVSHLNDQKEEDEDEDEEEGYVFAKMTRGSRDKRHGYGWACQNSLQVLKVGVNDVVMQYKSETPDLMVMAGSAAETAATGIKYYDNNKSCTFDVLTQLEYPACFHWFYNSIAQLTHLRELCLVSVTDPFDLGQMTREVCLTLKEGLDLWEGLKELEVLDVEYLNHQIGIEEDVRSNNADEGVDVNMEMEEDEEENEKGSKAWSEGVRWLKATRPDIELPVLEKRWKSALLLALEEEGDEDLLRDDG